MFGKKLDELADVIAGTAARERRLGTEELAEITDASLRRIENQRAALSASIIDSGFVIGLGLTLLGLGIFLSRKG